MAGLPAFVVPRDGRPRRVARLLLNVFGVKVECPTERIMMEQSLADRSKIPFVPPEIAVEVDSGVNGRTLSVRQTIARLHFAETTANNIRRKGRPNPEQRYFRLAVLLEAEVSPGETYTLAAMRSERIVVRSSNPSQFEYDGEALWIPGADAESVCHMGRVGINVESPDEALVVHGNVKVTGAIYQPSDLRIKDILAPVDPSKALDIICRTRLHTFRIRPEVAKLWQSSSQPQVGVIAQELATVLPSAVRVNPAVTMPDGSRVDNFLTVDKDQLFMHSIAALQALAKAVDASSAARDRSHAASLAREASLRRQLHDLRFRQRCLEVLLACVVLGLAFFFTFASRLAR